MLVLTRKIGERIEVGENIVIRIIRAGNRSVQLGIEAPREIRVIRSEVVGAPGPRPAPSDDASSIIEGSYSDTFPRHPRLFAQSKNVLRTVTDSTFNDQE